MIKKNPLYPRCKWVEFCRTDMLPAPNFSLLLDEMSSFDNVDKRQSNFAKHCLHAGDDTRLDARLFCTIFSFNFMWQKPNGLD